MHGTDQALLGGVPLRDHRATGPHVPPIDYRMCLYGYRMVRRATVKAPDKVTAESGDVQGAVFWETAHPTPDPATSGPGRTIGSWWFAAPAIGQAINPDGSTALIPLRNRALDYDDRYLTMDLAPPDGEIEATDNLSSEWDNKVRSVLDGRVPGGLPGILIAGSEETAHEVLYYSVGNALVCQHIGPDPSEFSTLVYELNEAGYLDPELKVGLHSALRVKRVLADDGAGDAPPLGLCLNFDRVADGRAAGKTRGRRDGYGLVVGRPIGKKSERGSDEAFRALSDAFGTFRDSTVDPLDAGGETSEVEPEPPPDERQVLAYLDEHGGGPISFGAVGADRHDFGENADGEKVRPAMLSAAAIFHAGPSRQGPLAFSVGPWRSGETAPFIMRVEFKLDGRPHTYLGPDSKERSVSGVFDWYTYKNFRGPGKPGDPSDKEDGGDDSGENPPEQPPQQPKQPPTETTTGSGDDQDDPADDFPVTIGGVSIKGDPTFPGGETTTGGGDVPGAVNIPPRPTHEVANVEPLDTPNEIGCPGVAITAQQPYVCGHLDTRYSANPDSDQMREWDRAPVVARFEGFGTDRDRKSFAYTRRPGHALARYARGTGSGGAFVTHPEWGVEDARQGAATFRTRGTVSTTWFGVVVKPGFGGLFVANAVSTALGAPVDGWRIEQEATSDDMVVAYYNGAGAATATPQITFSNPLDLNGGVNFGPIENLTSAGSPYTGSINTCLISADTSGGAISYTLPDASTCGGQFVSGGVTNGANNLTVAAAVGDTIDGAGSITIAPGGRFLLFSRSASSWMRIV